MQLFYAPEITPPFHTLSEEESKHCVRVLRLNTGDTLYITDGKGNLFCCELVDANPRQCSVRVTETRSEWEKLPYRLIMAVSPTKNNDRFEWFLEKATEIGVGEIVPLETDHSERRVFKAERGEKIITAAMKQSLKAYRPHLHPLTSFRAWVTTPFEGRKFIAHCDTAQSETGKEHLANLLKAGESVTILIGPEGDFSPEEIALAIDNGFEEITLGTQRLRTETAAVVATTMVATINAI